MEGPSRGASEKGGGYDQRGFERAHFHPREARQAHPSPEHVSEQQKCCERTCDGAQVDKGLLGARQLDIDIAFAVFRCVRRPCERGHEAVQGGGEQGGQGGLRADGGERAEVGAETPHPIADPGAEPCDHAGKPGLGADRPAEQQRKKRRDRKLADALVAIAAVFLHLAHDGGELFGARTRFLVEVPDE